MVANHEPQLLSEKGIAYMFANWEHRASRIKTMDQPAATISSVIAKGVPYGIFYPQGNREETVPIRNYNVTPQLPANGLTVAELFCGGGLMAVGLKAAGYDITFANDFDKRAAEAYAYNIGDHVICGDITDATLQAQIPDADIIAGGPPCQDYSVAGAGAGEDGERGKLVWTYLRIIAEKQPKAFVFENVKGLLTKKHRPTFDALLAQFDEIGYAVTWRVINAWNYGVAQKRERVFIVGVRKDLGFTFEFPSPYVWEYRTQVLRDVIGDLPEPKAQANGLYWSPKSEYTYDQANRVQSMDSACNTIPAHHNSGQPIHPLHAPRRFTVRECLRIQSVPDTYVLPDTISLSAQYRIVGNGVASRISYLIGVASRISYLIGVALAEQLNAALAVDLREAA